MNTPQAPTYQWDTILTHMTTAEWRWDDTGGGHSALIAELNNGLVLLITNENLSDEISPNEPVWLGVYPDPETDEALTYEPFANMGELLTVIGAITE